LLVAGSYLVEPLHDGVFAFRALGPNIFALDAANLAVPLLKISRALFLHRKAIAAEVAQARFQFVQGGFELLKLRLDVGTRVIDQRRQRRKYGVDLHAAFIRRAGRVLQQNGRGIRFLERLRRKRRASRTENGDGSEQGQEGTR